MHSLNSKNTRLKRTSEGSEEMFSRIKQGNINGKKNKIAYDYVSMWFRMETNSDGISTSLIVLLYINLALCRAYHVLFKIRENDYVFS